MSKASDGIKAVSKVHAPKPDVILLAMMMPRKDDLGTIEDIMKDQPGARILVLTSFAEDDKVFLTIKAGALGYLYLLKDSSPQELLQAIRNVNQGEASLHPTIARK